MLDERVEADCRQLVNSECCEPANLSWARLSRGSFSLRSLSHNLQTIRGFSEDSDSTPLDGPPRGADSPASAPLAALAGGALARRFCSWTGRSGERYVCSVFALDRCPSFADAIVLAVRCLADGRREVVAATETGEAPDLLLDDTANRFFNSLGASEWHVHLLCESASARRAAIADLLGTR